MFTLECTHAAAEQFFSDLQARDITLRHFQRIKFELYSEIKFLEKLPTLSYYSEIVTGIRASLAPLLWECTSPYVLLSDENPERLPSSSRTFDADLDSCYSGERRNMNDLSHLNWEEQSARYKLYLLMQATG